MNFLKTFVAILLIAAGIAWFMGDAPIKVNRSVIFNSMMQDEKVESIANHQVNPTVTVSVSNINGSITITGHDHNNAVIKITKKGNKKHFKDVQTHVDVNKNALTITTKHTERFSHQNVAVHYDLQVPHKAVIKFIESINGTIAIHDIAGPIDTKTVNGAVEVYNSQQAVTVYTVNGEVLYAPQSLTKGQDVSITTTNGAITCQLPKTFSAHLIATAAVGSIHSEFKIPEITKQFVGQKISTTLGNDPQGTLKLITSVGAITLQKK